MRHLPLVALLFLSLFCGCDISEESRNEDNEKLVLSESELVFTHSGGEAVVEVSSSTDDWSCGSPVKWMTCRRDGNSIVVNVESNDGTEERNTTLSVSTESGLSKTVAVRQSGYSGGGGEGTGTYGGSYEDENCSYTLDQNAIILPQELSDQIRDFDPVNFTFYAPKAVSENLNLDLRYRAGECFNIIVDTPSEQFPTGLLAQVQELQPDENGGYRVRYTESHVLSCFKQLEVSETDMDIASHVSKIVDADGNEIAFSTTKSASSDKLKIVVPQIDLDLPLGISVTPKMTIDLSMKSQVKIENYTLSTMNFIVDADCSIGADISAACDFTELTYTPQKKICSIIFAAFPVGPLVVTPSVDIYVFVRFDATLKLEASISYKRSFRAHAHYDEVAGLELSTRLEDEEPDAFQYSIGPKLEGGITYGLDIGPGISLYGGCLGMSIYASPGIQESVSAKLDVLDENSYTSERNALVFPWHSIMPTYECNFDLSVGASLYGFGYGFSAESPSAKWPLQSMPILPKLSDRIEVTNDGENAEFKLSVEGTSLLYGPISALLFDHDDPYDPTDYIYVDFDFDRDKYDELTEDGIAEIKASAELSPGKNYDLDVNVKINDRYVRLRTYETKTAGVDSRLSAAVRGILKDLLASASGEWNGCNWDDKTVPVGNYKNVELTNLANGKKRLRIDIPEDWPMDGTLKVTPHTTGLEDIFDEWELHIDGASRHFSLIDIDDPFLSEVYVCDHVDSFGLHSEISGISIYSLPTDIKTLDLSRCYGLSNEITFNLATYTKLEKIILDDCLNFSSVKVYNSDKKISATPLIQAKGSTTIGTACLSYLDLTNADFSLINTITKLDIRECKGTYSTSTRAVSLSIEGTYDAVTISACSNLKTIETYGIATPQLSIKANPSLETVKLFLRSSESTAEYINTLSVTDCPVLKHLECWDTGISSLTLTGLPALSELDCTSNRNLTGIMLPIFDEMFDRGCTPQYDQRYYSYWWNGDTLEYEDLGYGFYYSGEPDRGYHR